MLRRLLTILTLSFSLVMLTTAEAFAYNDGRGFYGQTTDTVITDTGFILIVGFALFVLVMSLIQGKLEKRKEARHAASKALANDPRWRGGW